MLLAKVLSAALLAAARVAADGASVLSALDAIASKTASLNDTVASWGGGPLGTLPILVSSAGLLATIDDGTRTVRGSAVLSDIEAFTVAVATLGLVADVNQTLASVVAARPKFDALLLGPVILLSLQQEKSATDAFSAALVAKVPADLQSAAGSLVAQIDESFDDAIAWYNLNL